MKTRRVIKISRKLCDKICSTDISFDGALFLLGKDKKGIFTKAIELKTSGGCEFMPGINKTDMAKAYIELVKKRVVPAAFGHLLSAGVMEEVGKESLKEWFDDQGEDANEHSGRIFIRFAQYSTYDRWENETLRDTRKKPVAIITDGSPYDEEDGSYAGAIPSRIIPVKIVE